MKKIALVSAALAFSAANALAADLPARVYTKAPAPVVAPIYNWSGFYVGLNAGGGWSHKCFDYGGFVTAPLPIAVRDNCIDASGALAGGQIGFRWQSAAWVFGLEAQGDWADLSGTAVSTLFPGNSGRVRVRGLGLFTGQVGYAWNNVLFYVKGGGAVTSDRYTTFVTATNLITGTASEDRWGGTVGAGLEFGFSPNWSVGVEYDHLFMGTRNVTFSVPAIAPLQPFERVHQDVDMGTVRVNYRFGGPVVAKY